MRLTKTRSIMVRVVLAASCALYAASGSYAGDIDSVCSPWFVPTVDFDRSTFPENVTITPTRASGYYPYIVDGMPVVIGNSGTAPLVLNGRARGLVVKVVANTTRLLPMWTLEDLASIRIKSGCGDDRPVATHPPDVQTFSLPIRVGDRNGEIAGRIIYRLNETYDPHAQANSPLYQRFLAREWNNTWLLPVELVIAIAVLPGGYWILKRQRRLRHSETERFFGDE